ncbi:MAG: hypothetical protein NZ869_04830, partial [Thermoanaerobaculum sp.]|nr:hypothetical protein [Thermoanaerobaculum sp.]
MSWFLLAWLTLAAASAAAVPPEEEQAPKAAERSNEEPADRPPTFAEAVTVTAKPLLEEVQLTPWAATTVVLGQE